MPRFFKQTSIRTSLLLVILAIFTIGFIISQKYPHKINNPAQSPNKSETPIRIAYQTGIDPSKLAQANGEYEAAIGQSIAWKKFDGGADVLMALAAGDVDIGNLGSSPFTAAISQGLPIEVFYIASMIGASEALITKPNIHTLNQLQGKKIATPFASTAHYSLLSALKNWQLPEQNVQIINLRAPEITAAWQRGDIDAAYVWEPVLSTLKKDGHVFVSSQSISNLGSPTYDLWVVRKDFAKQHPNVLRQFVQISNQQIEAYHQNPKAFMRSNSNIKKIANLTGSNPKDIPILLSGNRYLSLEEQKHLFHKQLPQDIQKTAQFLYQQGKIPAVKESYSSNINGDYLSNEGH